MHPEKYKELQQIITNKFKELILELEKWRDKEISIEENKRNISIKKSMEKSETDIFKKPYKGG